ncbi:MAG: class I adenylate-forming enzyme family protein [Paracoccaceae bacterium]
MRSICWKSEWAPLARRFAGLVAITDRDGDVTYAELFAAAAGAARRLSGAGVGPGDVVATMIPNSRLAVAASLGVTLSGAAEAPINPRLSDEEALHCLTLSGAKTLIVAGAVEAGFAAGVNVVRAETIPPDSFRDLPAITVEPEAWGRVMFTSGTTGKPKGVIHSQGGRWLANLLQRASLPNASAPGRRILLMTPYSHGASLLTQAYLDGGGAVTLLDGVAVEVVEGILRGGGASEMFAPPTVLAKIVAALEGQEIRGVATIFTGTAPLSPELYRQARRIFGPVVRVTFGKTEVFNPIAVMTGAETDLWYADPASSETTCVGWPASGVEVKIGDGDDPDAAGEGGERRIGPVMIRAQHMLAAILTGSGLQATGPEEFHRTGDLGFFDEVGRLHLVGREADVIKSGGYRVTPEEIEGKLQAALPHGELVIVGLPSAYWGEVITAVAAGAPPNWRELLGPALESLTGFKRPRLFVDAPEIARNAMGKIVRSRTRDAVLARHCFVDGRYPEINIRAAAD